MQHRSPYSRRGSRALPVLAVALVFLLSACAEEAAGTPEAAPAVDGSQTGSPGSVELVDGEDAVALIDGGATVVDVRTPEEFAAGHVDGALNIDLQSDSFLEQVSELPVDGTYVVYCASGNRSAQAASLMAGEGFVQLYDAGGFEDLVAAGAAVAGG